MSTEEKTLPPRRFLPLAGTFISVPEAFPGVDEGLVHAFKLGFQARPSQGSAQPSRLEQGVFVDVALLDVGALSLAAFDFKKLVRDCELLREVFLSYPEEVLKIIAALQPDAPLTAMPDALKKAQELGLTEAMALQKGGGILALVAVAVTILVLEACAPPTLTPDGVVFPIRNPPPPPHPMDAGAGPG